MMIPKSTEEVEIPQNPLELVIGQDEAKKVLSVAVYNHYKRLMLSEQGVDQDQIRVEGEEVEVEKSNVLFVGQTGTGKTLMAKTIARLLNVPFTVVDATVFTEADGFDCYTSDDLASWSGPLEIFHKSADFWADRSYWAPECYLYEGVFYLFATFGSEDGRMGVQVLTSTDPLGPFGLHSEGPVTPREWECLDGTLWLEDDAPWMVFCHEFVQITDGGMCAMPLAPDLKQPVGEPVTLFTI
jgi:hypothetical protein